MNVIGNIHHSFAEELQSIKQMIYQAISSDVVLLNDVSQYFFNAGSKKLRPLLTLICAKMFSYDLVQNGNNNIKIATAIELIHAATLLHDDVIDNSSLRRFKKTVNAVWDNKTSILVGDILFSQAFSLIIQARCFDILDCLSYAFNDIVMGEIRQLSYIPQKHLINKDVYYQIIGSKTAALFAASCKVGGIMSKQSPETLKLLHDFGYKLGIAFQITDDVLDYSASSNLGKAIGDDFFEGKITLPIIMLIEQANANDKILIHKLFNAEKRQAQELEQILTLLQSHDIFFKISQSLKAQIHDLTDILNSLEVSDNECKQYLYDIMHYCFNRAVL
jgi:octaprenyl-diphosphate synthase